MLRFNFLGPNFIGHSQKYPYKPINYFGPCKYFQHIIQILPTYYSNISPCYYPTWALTNITQLGLSQIFAILANLSLHKYFSYYYQNWAIKFCHLYKSPNSFTLWAKPKKPNKTHLKACCCTAPLKPVITWHLKACCYVDLKGRCYTAL